MTLLICIQLSLNERIKSIKLQARKVNSNRFNIKLYFFAAYKFRFVESEDVDFTMNKETMQETKIKMLSQFYSQKAH